VEVIHLFSLLSVQRIALLVLAGLMRNLCLSRRARGSLSDNYTRAFLATLCESSRRHFLFRGACDHWADLRVKTWPLPTVDSCSKLQLHGVQRNRHRRLQIVWTKRDSAKYSQRSDRQILSILSSMSLSDSVAASSSGVPGPDSSPPYSYATLMALYSIPEFGSALLLGFFWWNVPPALLAKIMQRIFGFDAVMEGVELEQMALEEKPWKGKEINQSSLSAEDMQLSLLSSSSTAEGSVNSDDVASLRKRELKPSSIHAVASSRLRMKPLKARCMVMGCDVQLDAIDTSDPALSRTNCDGSVSACSRMWIWLQSFLCEFLPSVERSRPFDVRVVRLLKRLLYLASVCTLMFLLDATVMSFVEFRMSPSPTPVSCPRGSAQHYCFALSGTQVTETNPVYIDCYDQDAMMPGKISFLRCYSFPSTTWSSGISALSSAAALLTLVFGALVQSLAWIFALIDQTRILYACHALSFVCFFIWNMLLVYRFETNVLAVVVPLLVISTCLSMTRLRLLIMEKNEFGKMKDDMWNRMKRKCGCRKKKRNEEAAEEETDDEHADDSSHAV
jgi:hypothetical protein